MFFSCLNTFLLCQIELLNNLLQKSSSKPHSGPQYCKRKYCLHYAIFCKKIGAQVNSIAIQFEFFFRWNRFGAGSEHSELPSGQEFPVVGPLKLHRLLYMYTNPASIRSLALVSPKWFYFHWSAKIGAWGGKPIVINDTYQKDHKGYKEAQRFSSLLCIEKSHYSWSEDHFG